MENDDVIFDSELYELPDFDATGYLPAGVHDCSIPHLAKVSCLDDQRRQMWPQLVSFLALPILSHQYSHAYLGGEFVSRHKAPSLFDVMLKTTMNYGPESLAVVAQYFSVGLDRFETVYSVSLHFWIEGAPDGLFDNPLGRKPENQAGPAPFHPARGVARVRLNGADALANIREMIRGLRAA